MYKHHESCYFDTTLNRKYGPTLSTSKNQYGLLPDINFGKWGNEFHFHYFTRVVKMAVTSESSGYYKQTNYNPEYAQKDPDIQIQIHHSIFLH